jgi:putative SOS response-associated peptidase YedK
VSERPPPGVLQHRSMCGRYRQTRDPREVAEFFEAVNPLPNRAPSWNIAPTQDALVVRRHPEIGARHLDALRWGLVPSWDWCRRGKRSPQAARG